jgi:ATP-dependent Clp protease ATP-binding subunit ClpC
VRQEVEGIIGQGQHAPPEGQKIPFTPRAKKALELSLREAIQLGHNYIGTEHALLGVIREGDGVGAQVLAKLGADLGRVRQQVIHILHGYQGKQPATASDQPRRPREPGADDLAEQCRQLRTEVTRLRALLRQHGIEPGDKTA